MQIIVLGTQRSGSSLVTRLLNMSGAYFGHEGSKIGFTREKQKGFWERQDVVEVNDTLLKVQESSFDSLAKWNLSAKKPTKKKLENAEESISKIKDILAELNEHDDWVIKDERLCLTLPYWKPLLDKPVVVIVSRCPEESVLSMTKRSHNSLSHSSSMWEYYTVSMLNAASKMNVVHVSHKELVEKPVETLTKLVDGLSKLVENKLKLPNESEINSFVNEELWLTKTDKDDKDSLTTAWQQKLYSFASEKSLLEDKQVLEVSKLAEDAMKKHEVSVIKADKLGRSNGVISKLDQMVNELSQELEAEKEQFAEFRREQEELLAEQEEYIYDEEPSFVCKIINLFGKKAA